MLSPVCHLNAQSFVNKIDEVSAALLDAKWPTILGKSETWLNDTISDGEVSISSSTIQKGPQRKERRRNLGVHTTHADADAGMTLKKTTLKPYGLNCTLRFHTILLCNVYRPSSSDSSTLPSIIDMVEAVTSQGKKVVVLGDLNCSLLSCNQLGDEPKSDMENLLRHNSIQSPLISLNRPNLL